MEIFHKAIVTRDEKDYERTLECYAQGGKFPSITLRETPIGQGIGLKYAQAKQLRDFLNEAIAKFDTEPTA